MPNELFKPTAREVRVILAAASAKPEEVNCCIFNDKRSFGGRLKLCGRPLNRYLRSTLGTELVRLFPGIAIDVYVFTGEDRCVSAVVEYHLPKN